MNGTDLLGYDPDDDDDPDQEEVVFPETDAEILADTFMRQAEWMAEEGFTPEGILYGLNYAAMDLSASMVSARENEFGSELEQGEDHVDGEEWKG